MYKGFFFIFYFLFEFLAIINFKSSLLRNKFIYRSNNGNFTCFALNILRNLYSPSLIAIPTVSFDSKPEARTSQSTVFINVKRRPGAAFIAVDNNVLEVGQRVVLTCTTDDFGNPPAKFRWEIPNG